MNIAVDIVIKKKCVYEKNSFVGAPIRNPEKNMKKIVFNDVKCESKVKKSHVVNVA